MVSSKHFLITGGIFSALISILHVILAYKPELYEYVVPATESALSQMAEQGSILTTIASTALALIFAIWAIYAFSGAGLVVRMPLLRLALFTIGAIYILRALFLPTEINMVVTQGYSIRFVLFSTISLVTGLLYLIGVLTSRAALPPAK